MSETKTAWDLIEYQGYIGHGSSIRSASNAAILYMQEGKVTPEEAMTWFQEHIGPRWHWQYELSLTDIQAAISEHHQMLKS